MFTNLFSDKKGLGFVESVSTFVVHPPKFVPAISISFAEVKVSKEEILATRRTRVDLSESKPKKPNHLGSKKQHKSQCFCHFYGEAGHTCPNCFKLQASKQATKQKVSVPKGQDLMALIHELVKVLNFMPIHELNLGLIHLETSIPSLHLRESGCKRLSLSESV